MNKPIFSFKNFNNYLHSKLYNKYLINPEMNNNFLIEKIVYNEKCRLVAIYKDFLILDDDFEFVKQFYELPLSLKKLKIYLEYYEKYSIIFPNYSMLSESKYIYKNIHKKQKMIDNLQKEKKEIINKTINNLFQDNQSANNEISKKDIFGSNTYISILKNSENGCSSIFGLTNKISKDEEDNISVSQINDIIKNIDNNERKTIQKKNNFKLINDTSRVKLINNINARKNNKKRNEMKWNTNNTSNNTYISFNIYKSNTIKNNNTTNEKRNNIINENNKIMNQLNILNSYKTLSKEKKTIKTKTYISNKLKKNKKYPLKLDSSKKSLKLLLQKLNAFKNIKKEKIEVNNKIENKIKNCSTINIKKMKKEGKNKNLKNIVIKIDINNKKINNYNTINYSQKKNNKINISYKNNKNFIDLKKCLSEKKLYKNNSKIQTINNQIIINNKINIKKLNIRSNLLMNNKSYIGKKSLVNSILTSYRLTKKHNTYSNIQNKKNKKYYKKYNTINNISNYINFNNNFNNSYSVKVIKNKFNDINRLTDGNRSEKYHAAIINKVKYVIKKNNIIINKLFPSNSCIKKDEDNKKYFGKFLIETKTKEKIAINNNILNLSDINGCLNTKYIYNNPHRKLNENKSLSKKKNKQIKKINKMFYLKEKRLKEIKVNTEINSYIKK